jgi:ABC-type branched-subunit amino acid transport system ATPase component
MSMLVTKGLVKKFGGVSAVDHVDATFEGGKITALVGPNGSGKTTLINTITGLLPIDGGSVVVGESAEFQKIRPSNIATYGMTRTFQSVRLIEQMTVLDNILLVLTERGVFDALFEQHASYHHAAAEEVLRKVGLWEKRHEHAGNLSYGQRKLLEIARALSMQASIFFFDEPFAGIFREVRKIIEGVLRELRADGATVVLVEHDMDIIRDLADYCYVLDSGKILAEGKPDDVLARRAVVDAYLGK